MPRLLGHFLTPVKSSCLVLVGGEWLLSFSLGPKRLSAQSSGIDSLRELTTEASRLDPSFGVSDLFQVSLPAVAAGHSNAQAHDPRGRRLESEVVSVSTLGVTPKARMSLWIVLPPEA